MAIPTARCVSVLVLLLAMVAGVVAAPKSCIATFPVAGRKFILKNGPLQEGLGEICPDGNPSTATFCNTGKRVTIVGYFAGADLGVCDSVYALKPTDVVTYEQYGNMVIFRMTDRVPSAMTTMLVEGKKIAVALSGQRYYATTMVDSGPANC